MEDDWFDELLLLELDVAFVVEFVVVPVVPAVVLVLLDPVILPV